MLDKIKNSSFADLLGKKNDEKINSNEKIEPNTENKEWWYISGSIKEQKDDIFKNIVEWLDIEIKNKKKPINKIELWYKATTILLPIVIVFVLLSQINIYLKTTNDDEKNISSYLDFLCPYLSSDIKWYNNTDCLTLPKIKETVTKERETLEKNLWDNLSVLIPLKYAKANILSNPEILFIQETNWDNRIRLTKVLDDFWVLVKNTNYQAECSNPKLDEKWTFSASCEFYWVWILSPWYNLGSSRMTTLKFLKNFENESNPFILKSYPDTLEISSFTSDDLGIKSTFSTKTSLDLKLLYKNNK